ncbi:hypothetical protein DUF3343 [Gottschalkia acidurici 9a]|uniref:Putative Se/S carrier protein-like domain-containing protein n=1 Tax=Gottschalkia acidurici (strain ATCC 7906 / DSM 604 / BCRC 14475 / CIP 104303 / KCTC 5404 / NCIMB 10678 / 9a) TaxID=1128398 RepID=K0B4Q4_GOTA9|nr:DUF3343 domain-containing protein [Gottschalkia acidurici]AFS79556.1 hypothetical protein DUF3343 [Gottschalkia acidurici 9a]
MNKYYCVVTFEITSHAFIFEKEMKKRNIDIKLISTPRELSSSCGLSSEIPCKLKSDVEKICRENHIEASKIYELEREKDKKSIFKIFNK